MRPLPRPAPLLLSLLLAACATVPSPPRGTSPSDADGVLATQRGWWRALATGDTAFLEAHSAQPLTLTLSSGLTLDRAAAIAQSLSFAGSSPPAFGWSEETVRVVAPGVVVATTRSTETVGLTSSAYRYLTVLEREGAGWRVLSAQSTRDAVFTPRLTAAEAGPMGDYVGEYRGPRGGTVRVVARDSVLAMVEPSGRELRMEPIGPSLFEFDYVSPGGMIIRIAFARDANGRVTSANRLIPGSITTLVRVP
ncbi:MAG TPA: nuclear transport factor 2 family protein [Longimicrobium sp.]|jgi:hypothetical protein|uniref:nuclear transport factor 2 family protein n=1 Tax=Longimicrobium sp. TaxID=2029185 RepID=UPI002EDA6E12